MTDRQTDRQNLPIESLRRRLKIKHCHSLSAPQTLDNKTFDFDLEVTLITVFRFLTERLTDQ